MPINYLKKAALLAALALPLIPAQAYTFEANFDDGQVPVGMSLADPAKIVPSGGFAGTGYLSLTDAAGSLNGTAIIEDFASGEVIGGFRASMKIRIGNGSGRPADGFSVSFGPDVADSGGGEDGSGSGLRVSLDTYDNGGGEAPGLDIFYGGVVIAHTSWSGATVPIANPVRDPVTGLPASLSTGTDFLDLIIDLHPNGTLDVVYKGITVYTNLVIPGYTPTNVRFALSARTGGEFETHWVDSISIVTVPPATGAPTVKTPPASVSAPERGNASFSVVPDGAPPFEFQWYKNDVAIDGEISSSLSLTGLTMADNQAKFRVTIVNAEGSKDSPEATLTVIPDTVKPTVVRTVGSDNFVEATVVFSEPVTAASAGLAANYTISGGLTVSEAVIINETTVRLTTSAQTQGTTYNITIAGVQDTAATPNTIAAPTVAPFVSYIYQRGGLKMEIFTDIGGTAVDALLSADKFINNTPDSVAFVTQASSRQVYGGGVLDNYGGRMSGWIIPPETAQYEFFIRSDDGSALFLSPDADPANGAQIAFETGCCNPFQEPGLGFTQTSEPQDLVAGQRYHIAILWKEGGGGDYADLAWRKVGDPAVPRALPYIPGAVLETLAPPNTFVPPTVSITSPTDQQGFEVGVPVTISAEATAAAGKTIVRVEFFELAAKLGEDTEPPYSLTLNTLTEDAHKFTVKATDSSGITTETAPITISVGGLKKRITLAAIDDVTTWKYDRSGQDLGTEWREPGFDDSAWPSGKALIADETTTTVEPIRTAISRFNDEGAYVRTFYFRTHFNFPNAVFPGVKLALRHVMDDGIVIYLNGKEVHRFGITDDPVHFLSNAAGHENAYEGPYDISILDLKPGDNVIAAEVHQSGGSSSDMVFGLELVATVPAITQTLFAIDDVTSWKYDRSGQDLGTAWSAPAFDDAAWPSGKALIADETTTTVEPIRTAISRFNDEGAYVRTFYFRHKFAFNGEVGGAKLKLRHVVDDGAVFYLNGSEVSRLGITDDPVHYLSNAAGHENAYEGPIEIPLTALVTGENTFAVEVHQSGGSSSDMVFGAELVGTYFPVASGTPVEPTKPKLTISGSGGSLQVSWTEGGKLQESTQVNTGWTDVAGNPTTPFTISSPTGTKFFRVVKP